MNLSVIPEETLNQLINDISEIKGLINSKMLESNPEKWLNKKEAKQKLNVCLKTLDNYLKKGIIPHTQFGAKIYIKQSDIDEHLERHYVKKNF